MTHRVFQVGSLNLQTKRLKITWAASHRAAQQPQRRGVRMGHLCEHKVVPIFKGAQKELGQRTQEILERDKDHCSIFQAGCAQRGNPTRLLPGLLGKPDLQSNHPAKSKHSRGCRSGWKEVGLAHNAGQRPQ